MFAPSNGLEACFGVGMIAVLVYLVVLVAVGIFASGLLASVLIGGVGGVLGIGVGTAVAASALR